MSHLATPLTFLFLAASIAALWLPRPRSAWAYFFSASLACAALAGVASATGILLLAGAMWCMYLLGRADEAAAELSALPLAAQMALAGAFSFLAVGIATGFLPGFEKVVWYRDVQLTPDAASFSLSLNYGKVAIGALILGLGCHALRAEGGQRPPLLSTLLAGAVSVAAVSALAVALGYARIEPKWHGLFWPWAMVNLLFVCVAEEAFFARFCRSACRAGLRRCSTRS